MRFSHKTDFGKKNGWFVQLHYITETEYARMNEQRELEAKQKAMARIDNQFNAPVTISGDMNTAQSIQTKPVNITTPQGKKKWYEIVLVQWVISFVLGVAASIAAQLLLNYFLGVSLTGN
jgi:hypothetical protein